MPNRNYKSGYMFELNTKHVLEKKGYYVMASRGSHGPIDLIAVKDNYILGLQLKKDCNISEKERKVLLEMNVPGNMYLSVLQKIGKEYSITFIGKIPIDILAEKIQEDLNCKEILWVCRE